MQEWRYEIYTLLRYIQKKNSYLLPTYLKIKLPRIVDMTKTQTLWEKKLRTTSHSLGLQTEKNLPPEILFLIDGGL